MFRVIKMYFLFVWCSCIIAAYEYNLQVFHDIFIVDDVQEKLLSDYEAELKTKKPSHAKKDSNASDDWEKLSNEGK